jgi:hypothetical protein
MKIVGDEIMAEYWYLPINHYIFQIISTGF